MAYYRRIRELREDNDKTQREVAEYLGTPYQYYAVYEKGTSEISFERAIALAKYYNVSLDYIAGLTNNKKGLASSDLTDEQQALLNFAETLTDSEKGKAVELLKRLIKIME
ncbi:MAG: helix-turn-helix transcriptional regulator [Oscillospiraceae bacterium]|nr:helix-turn-helix transcriptional regulator [Oscillospiraceae bacterium]